MLQYPPRQDKLLSLILSSTIPCVQQTRLKLYHVPGSCGSHGLSFQLKVSLLCVTEAAPPSLITSLHPGSGLLLTAPLCHGSSWRGVRGLCPHSKAGKSTLKLQNITTFMWLDVVSRTSHLRSFENLP